MSKSGSKTKETLAVWKERAERFLEWGKRRTATDAPLVFIILLLALLLRVPLLSYPDRTLFDEAIYAHFIIQTENGHPFFDIHPPFARILFASVAENSTSHLVGMPMKTGEPFSDFPYESLRVMIAILGSLLPLCIYAIGRLLDYTPRQAAIPALFVVFDNALVLYSRTILPDTLLLLANMLAFATALAALKSEKYRLALSMLSGVMMGIGLSIKWTALGVAGLIWLCFLLGRRYSSLAVSFGIAVLMYAAVFSAYFFWFPEGGKMAPVFPAYDTPWIMELSYPKAGDLEEIFSFLPAFHGAMLQANRDPQIAAMTLQAPGPISWPINPAPITFWVDQDRRIELIGNELLWFTSFLLLLFEIGWIAWHLLKTHLWPIDRTESVLLGGYVMNYLPFFLIERPMFLYHYFTALLFLLLLIPRVAPRMMHCIGMLANDRWLPRALCFVVCLLIVVNFFLLAPVTYGI